MQTDELTKDDDDEVLLFAPGRAIGRYVVLEPIGRGGMGTVLKAYDQALDRAVALKLLHSDPSARQAQRLRREAQALAQLSHPNVVDVYEVGKTHDRWFIAMEFVEGPTLRSWQQEPRDWQKRVRIYLQAGEGLAAAHDARLIHRDFKPDNCMIDHQGRLKVLDFGLVRQTDLPSVDGSLDYQLPAEAEVLIESLTKTGTVLGTIAYMPLEQLSGGQIDARSDQFSFCVSLYEALYGERPFTTETVGQLAVALMTGDVRPAPADSSIPVKLRKVLLRGLSADPTKRWPSMRSLLLALRRVIAPPGRRWSSVALSGGLCIAVGSLMIAREWGEHRGDPLLCDEGAEQLHGYWDAERGATLRKAFMATELPHAADALAGTRARLDHHSNLWIGRYEAVCMALREDKAPEVLDQEMACLHRRREELGALVDLLIDGTPELVTKATEAAATLEPITSCKREATEALAMQPPREDQQQGVNEVRLLLARANASYKTSEFHIGIELANKAMEQARGIAYPPAEAEAMFRLGVLQGLSGLLEDARGNLAQSAFLATSVRHDRISARAAIRQAFVVGYQQAQYEEGLWWLRHAQAAIERLEPDAFLQAELRATRGAVLAQKGHYSEALDEFEVTLEQRKEAVKGDDHPLLASTYNNLASVLTELGRHEEALVAEREAVRIWSQSYGSVHPVVGTALSGLGAILEQRGQFSEAREHLEMAVEIREAVFGGQHINVALPLDNLGSVLTRLGYDERARQVCERARDLRKSALAPQHPYHASSWTNLGIIAEKQRRFDDAVELHRQAIDLWEGTLGPDHPYLGYPLTSLARVELERGRDEEARRLLRRALRVRKSSRRVFELVETRSALARAVWSEDPASARRIADQAVEDCVDLEYGHRALCDELERWLADHPAP